MNARQRRKQRRRHYAYGPLRLHFYGEGSYQLGRPPSPHDAPPDPGLYIPDLSTRTPTSGSWQLGEPR